MNYFVIEEDISSINKVYLGEINLEPEERENMLLGFNSHIPSNNLLIQIKNRISDVMSDYLSIKFTFVSHRLKEIIEDNAKANIFYRDAFLFYDGLEYNYHYFSPQEFDCLMLSKDNPEKDKRGGFVKMPRGGQIKKEVVEGIDIFRIDGLSNRTIVITEKLKTSFEQNDVRGIKYTPVNEWTNIK